MRNGESSPNLEKGLADGKNLGEKLPRIASHPIVNVPGHGGFVLKYLLMNSANSGKNHVRIAGLK